MSHIHMFIGIPGSGKTTRARKFASDIGADYFSSDSLREELYGDESIQKDHQLLFAELEKRIKVSIEQGRDVVYDATNTNRKKRMHFINTTFRKYSIVGHVLLTSYELAILRNNSRERVVNEEVIKNKYKHFQFPMKCEGFSDIYYEVPEKNTLIGFRTEIEKTITTCLDYELLFEKLYSIKEFQTVWELPQDSTYHSFSASRHIYYVYKGIFDEYLGEDRLVMLYAALFHDIGKGFCKSFYNYEGKLSRYANYIGHENVSAYLAFRYLMSLGYDLDFVLKVTELVSLHMMPKNQSEKINSKLKKWLSPNQYRNLMILNEFDNSAK